LPSLLYNIAQTARRAGQADKAMRSFQQYLDEEPRAPERRQVLAWIAELRAERASAPPLPPPPPPIEPPRSSPRSAPPLTEPPPPSSSPPPAAAPIATAARPATATTAGAAARRWRVAAWSLGGAAVAVAIVGVTLVGYEESRRADLQRSCAPFCPPQSYEDDRTRWYAGYGLIGVAGAITISAAIVGARAHRAR
jgi:hypothetical protein